MPLWKQLRPSLHDFIGNGLELAGLESYQGSVIFTGPWGCGKSSTACALASSMCGAQIDIDDGFQAFGLHQGNLATFGGYINLDREANRAALLRHHVLAFEQISGKRVFIIDEAHRISPTLQDEFKASIERRSGNQYLFCTPFLQKLSEPLKQVCRIVTLRPLPGIEAEQLIDRAWAAVVPDRPVPQQLATVIARFKITSPRAILDVVEDVAAGIPVLDAAVRRTP